MLLWFFMADTTKFILDFSQYLLPSAIFFFKFLEWWYHEPRFEKPPEVIPPPPEPPHVCNSIKCCLTSARDTPAESKFQRTRASALYARSQEPIPRWPLLGLCIAIRAYLHTLRSMASALSRTSQWRWTKLEGSSIVFSLLTKDDFC